MFFNYTRPVFNLSQSGAGGSFPQPLTASEEAHYLAEYQKGSTEAKDVLIERNLRLVAHIAKKYGSADNEDLISIGTIGLIKGIITFNPNKGTKLATYASRCIENAIIAQRLICMNMSSIVCLLPPNVVCFVPFQAAV